jgi:hypothetical protein
LLDFGIKHQICRNYVIIISDTLLDILSSIFKNINKISQDGDYEYYGSDKFKIFSYDYLSQNVKLTIEIWEIFRKIKLEPSTISTIITWYMQHISSKIKIKVRRVEPRGYTINPKIWITNRSI